MPRIKKDTDPGLASLVVPAAYLHHPLVRLGPFYTLPEFLLKSLVKEIGESRFDPALLKMETDMCEACGGQDAVGLWKGNRIQFPLLRFQPLDFDLELSQSLGWTKQQITAVNTIGSDRVERFANVARGYAGWLLTNRTFLAEHDDIIKHWQEEIREFGIPVIGFVVHDASSVPKAIKTPGSNIEQFLTAFEAFFVRWRLEGLTAPYLPSPLRPQLPVAILTSVLGHMRGGGQTFYMPDTYPVPTRDELRGIIEDALRGSGTPAHLTEWAEHVRATNTAKNSISRYARLFELQHYACLLYRRHAVALRQSKAAMNEAFATFLKVSTDSVEKDLGFIAERLGTEWYLTRQLPPSQES